MTKEETLKGLKCCAEFLCDECPYKIYEHIDYKLRCIHKLIIDLNEIRSNCDEKIIKED